MLHIIIKLTYVLRFEFARLFSYIGTLILNYFHFVYYENMSAFNFIFIVKLNLIIFNMILSVRALI